MKSNLNGQSILLLSLNGLFVFAAALSGTFLNVYLWKSRQDYAMIGWFNVSQQIALGIMVWVAGKWVKEHNKMNALRVGTALSGLFYLVVLYTGSQAVNYIWPLGMLLGAALGLFWLAFNVIFFEVTDRVSRDHFNGWVGLLGSFSGIVGPWLSGWIIARMEDDAGYRVIFSISLALYVVGVVLSFFLRKRNTTGSYNWLEPKQRLSQKGSMWRPLSLSLVTQGIREGVFAFLITLLVYVVTQQEWKLAQFSLITSAVSFFSFWAVGKWLKPQYRAIGMLLGAVLLVIVLFPLLWRMQYSTLLIMGIGTALFLPLYLIPMISASFDLMGVSEEDVNQRVELVVLRELCLMVGRLTGMLIFLVVLSMSKAPIAMIWLLIGLALMPVAGWVFMRNVLKKEQTTKQSKSHSKARRWHRQTE
ncbi:MFS transporter [Paenibacillus terrae]|uniref:MFS transporter n=1 Tax=Paenibacillus terrae TaxID=159743 RepID=A0A4U2PXM4_9BACL|nr:MFS transporter [Paenibacillus terrae]TKH44377.1 MFS transporter [Paenibacillus terrae]